MKWNSAAASSDPDDLSEGLARSVLDALQAHVAVLDHHGRIVLINAAWRRFAEANGLGLPGEGLGADYLAACDASAARGDATARTVAAGIRSLLRSERGHFHVEYPFDSPTQALWFGLHASACAIGTGPGVVVLHVDLTQRRQTEMALAQSEARHRAESLRIARTLELSKDAICTLDREGRFVSANAAAERLWGIAPQQLVGTSVFDLIAETDRAAAKAAHLRLLTGCDTHIFEIRCVHAEGRLVDVMWTGQWSDADQRIFAVARDVTALRAASREQVRLARRLTSMLEQIHDAFVLLDDDWHFRYVNRRAEQLTGHARTALVGRVLWEVFPDLVGKPTESEFRRAVADREKVTFEVTYADRRNAVHAYPTPQGLAVYFVDVTEHHRAVEALRRAASTQAFIVRVQQELSSPHMDFDALLATICARAKEMTAAHGASVDLQDDSGRLVTRAASEGHEGLIGKELALEASFTGEVVRERAALLCDDVGSDPRVDLRLAREAGAAALIGAPIRDEVGVFGVLKVFSDRAGAFQQNDVGNLQILAESLGVVLQRLRARRELERINRAQQLLSLSNLAQARAEDEAELLREICRLAVEAGGYCSAAVVGVGPGGTLATVAAAGAPLGAPGAPTTLASDPSTDVLRSRETRVFQRLPDDPETEWAARARAMGIGSASFLPLRDGPSAMGVLCLYAAEPDAFAPDELQMLHDLAGDLAFGIRHIRNQHERRRLEQAVITVAAEVSATNGAEFFERLCASMAQALDAPATFAARIVRHSGTPRVRTLAGVVDGHHVPAFEYDCRGTPCERLLGEEEVVVRDGLLEGGVAGTMGLADARSCLGRALLDAKGTAMGVLVVMRRDPLDDVAFVSSLLRIFAARATAELARRQTDLRLREQASLLDQAKDAIVLRGLDGRIRYWNKGAERLFGWTSEEATEASSTIPLHDDPDALADAVGFVLSHDEWSGQMEQRHRDGRLIPTEAHWTLVRDAEGRPQSILAINTDISRRLAVESQLRQSQRLESVGQLTGGVAHDFNNLLTVILGNAELLSEQLGRDPDLQELAEMIRSAAQRGADLTHRLLAFARRQNLNPRSIDVGALVNGVTTLLRRTVAENIRIERDTATDLWPCLADAAQLEAAILNLSLNARDAMPRGGRLVIRSRNQRLAADDAERPTELAPGDYVRIAVIDEGTGISAEDLPRVVEPFFTTKPVGKGTGLGLSMVYGFARQSQGHLLIESSPGRGTTVTLFLPRADAECDVGSSSPTALRGGTESILLAEDDPLVRRFAEDQLRKLGYDVMAVEDGLTALRVLSSEVRVDLLFTDVVMPGGLGGPELVEAARRIRPGLPALYSSGYSEDALDHLEPARDAPLLRKPYRRAELAQSIRAALEKPQPRN